MVLSHVNDYIEPMMFFTAWPKIYSTNYLCNARVAGLGEIFIQQKSNTVGHWPQLVKTRADSIDSL